MNTNYRLVKYSRPSDEAFQLPQPTSADSQWQHFANPTLQLILGSAGPNTPLTSARVRIVWESVRRNEPPGPSQGHIVLEDVDLLTFSPASSLPAIGSKSHSPNLPLKAVYRDSVVGFRYLHPRIPPAYRRFQVVFPDPSIAKQFIDHISSFCPCKESPPSATAVARRIVERSTVAASETFSKRTNTASDAPAFVPVPISVPLNTRPLDGITHGQWPSSQVHFNELSSQIPPTTPKRNKITYYDPLAQPSLPHGTQAPLLNPLGLSSSAASSVKFPPRSGLIHSGTSIPSSPLMAHMLRKDPGRVDKMFNGAGDVTACHSSQPVSALPSGLVELPCASQNIDRSALSARAKDAGIIELSRTSSSSNPGVSCQEFPNRNSNEACSSPSMPALSRDLCAIRNLYDMPVDQLERIVAEVVREPGFLGMLEKLDSMWKVKGFISKE